MSHDPRLERRDANRVRVHNPHGVAVTLFANDDVPVESAAVTELVDLLELQATVQHIATLAPNHFDTSPTIKQVAITPDFHKAKGIPVGTVLATQGFVVPQAIGNDINCGMRVHVTTLPASVLDGKLDAFETAARHLFFEGGRNIPMTRTQREALFTEGLPGLFNAVPRTQRDGIWELVHELDVASELDHVERHGALPAKTTHGLSDFMGPADRLSRDGHIGSIGGGNHFVELQRVEKILDGTVAHAWGLKLGALVVMVHTGSVGIGHCCGGKYRDHVRQMHPATLKHPDNGIFVLPTGERHQATANAFWDGMNNAANFAFANRMFLALLALQALRETCDSNAGFKLVYDAPHNLVWPDEIDGEPVVIHRKGACPARGFEAMADTPFAYYGEPVLVPGSMGASSFILVGQGNAEALCSASHGAGRRLSRGDAMHGHEAEFADFMKRFRVVTPLDFRRADVQARQDILAKKWDEIKQEAPHAYKGIGPIIQTLHDAGIARPVAELTPLLTIKG